MKTVPYQYMTASGRLTWAHAYPTRTPGLGVAEFIDHKGRWTVVHLRSGTFLNFTFGSPEGALAFACALNPIADWTHTGPELAATEGLAGLVALFGIAAGGRHDPGATAHDPVAQTAAVSLDNGGAR